MDFDEYIETLHEAGYRIILEGLDYKLNKGCVIDEALDYVYCTLDDLLMPAMSYDISDYCDSVVDDLNGKGPKLEEQCKLMELLIVESKMLHKIINMDEFGGDAVRIVTLRVSFMSDLIGVLNAILRMASILDIGGVNTYVCDSIDIFDKVTDRLSSLLTAKVKKERRNS